MERVVWTYLGDMMRAERFNGRWSDSKHAMHLYERPSSM